MICPLKICFLYSLPVYVPIYYNVADRKKNSVMCHVKNLQNSYKFWQRISYKSLYTTSVTAPTCLSLLNWKQTIIHILPCSSWNKTSLATELLHRCGSITKRYAKGICNPYTVQYEVKHKIHLPYQKMCIFDTSRTNIGWRHNLKLLWNQMLFNMVVNFFMLKRM